jgi:hypothetical protein
VCEPRIINKLGECPHVATDIWYKENIIIFISLLIRKHSSLNIHNKTEQTISSPRKNYGTCKLSRMSSKTKIYSCILTTHINGKFTSRNEFVDPFKVRFLNKVCFQCIVCACFVLDFRISEAVTDCKTLKKEVVKRCTC